jgi:drug/metabolite transporter (DMT)-like permease
VVLAFSGIIVALGATAFGQRNSNALFGDGLMLMGVLCAAVYSVFSRATLMRHGPLFVTALAMAFAVVVLLPIVAFGQAGVGLPAFNLQEWLAVVFLGDNRRHRAVLAFHVGIALVASDHHGLVPDAQSDHGHDPGIALLGEKLTIELVAGMTLVLVGILVGSGLYRVQKKNGVNAPAGNAAQINPPTTVR